MNIKLVLYCFVIPYSFWVIASTNLDRIFKKNSIIQIHSLYIILSLIISYLLVNFIYDIYSTIQLL